MQPDDLFDAADAPPFVTALEALPHIVVVIDEPADMKMVVGKKVEELIASTAQTARAAGINLIVAKQRTGGADNHGLEKAKIQTARAREAARQDEKKSSRKMSARG